MNRDVYSWSASLAIVGSLLLPLAVSAQTLAPGCRLATPQDQAEMVARGLPRAFQVCPRDAEILGIGRDFEQWYAQIKSQSPCNRNTCTLSCRTRNTGAQVCGPTATRWNSIGCHPNNRTAIFPTVSHGFAAHIELLRRYCGERGRCTIGSVIQQWTATAGDRSSYASFVSRNAGIPVNQVFDPNDIDLMGRLALAMSCFEAGSLPYNVAELKQGLIMAGGGARVPVPPNVGQLLNESLTGSYAANSGTSPNSHPGSWAYPQSSVSGNNYRPPPPPASPLPVLSPPGVSPTNPTGVPSTPLPAQSAQLLNSAFTNARSPIVSDMPFIATSTPFAQILSVGNLPATATTSWSVQLFTVVGTSTQYMYIDATSGTTTPRILYSTTTSYRYVPSQTFTSNNLAGDATAENTEPASFALLELLKNILIFTLRVLTGYVGFGGAGQLIH